tara:strand:- start:433 stop:627 length:195 start_codon:yes stop_codon:yes gene_type:complete
MKLLIDDITGYMFEYRKSFDIRYRSLAFARRFNIESPVITPAQAIEVFYMLTTEAVQPIIIDIE